MAYNRSEQEAQEKFQYDVMEDFDYVIEEKGNRSLNLRRVRWGRSDEYKLDLRRWDYTSGEERASRGFTMSEEAADELANVLVEVGHGSKRRILKALENRPDEPEEEIEEEEEENFYDPKELIS